MMYDEFMKLAGYEVTRETYDTIIEPMYMATPDSIDKVTFIKMLDRKAFALPTRQQLIRKMKTMAQHLAETCEHYTDWETAEELEKTAKEFAKRFYGIDWSNDLKSYVYFNREYTYPDIKRGCTYPCELVIGRDSYDYERIKLV